MSNDIDDSNKPNKTVGMKGVIMDNCCLKDVRFDGYDTVFEVDHMTNNTLINFTARSPEALKILASIREGITTSKSVDLATKNKISTALDEVEKADKQSFLVKYATFVDCVKNHIEIYESISPWIARLGVIMLSS